MGDVICFGAAKAHRQVDALLDELAAVRQCAADLCAHAGDGSPIKGPAGALVVLVDRLAHIGIAQIGAAMVMGADFDRRLRELAAASPSAPRSRRRPSRTIPSPLIEAMEA